MARSRKAQTGDLPSQPDPRAPLDDAAFLRAARPVLAGLTADLLTRADADEGIRQALQRHHQAELDASRTAEDYSVWRRRVVVQVAVAWLLSCVFVRVLEDRGLISARIAGPGASDSQDAFVRFAPSLGEREYLLTVFRELSHLPAAKALFHRDHNLVWRLGPSAEGCKALLRLFRTPNADTPAFRFGYPNTRFLGDLYQNLDEDVRDHFALWQTPDFIEHFILDRTLEPAFREYGVDHTDLIDPTCGSGHFLLGAFPRFVGELRQAHPALDDRTLAATALEHIYGADINPYAVAIARFRLTLQFLDAGGYTRLLHTPAPTLNVIVADSLYYGFAGGQGDLGERPDQSPEQTASWYGKGFSLEDPEAARHVLVDRTYAAVVGNPPYITVKDPALRKFYHDNYAAAAGKYALSAPFMERFFQLAKQGGGYVGQITSNSFMKREFGVALIEKVLRHLDIDLIVNTAGAFIPGHDTPTVLIFGRNQLPSGDQVDAVLAKNGEPEDPLVPAEGKVWRSISQYWNEEGFENDYISVEAIPRQTLDVHPWSLEGGGAGALKHQLDVLETVTAADGNERAIKRLTLDKLAEIGFASFTGLDDAFIYPRGTLRRHGLSARNIRPFAIGESIRDWGLSAQDECLCPYDVVTHIPTGDESEIGAVTKFLWPCRTSCEAVTSFGGKSRGELGEVWWQWYRWQALRYRAPLRICHAFIATHNHFLLSGQKCAFNRSAPIIILPEDTSGDDHLILTAYLNSSLICFYIKQITYPKGTTTGDISTEKGKPENNRYEFSGAAVGGVPLPSFDRSDNWAGLLPFGKALERLQVSRDALTPHSLLSRALDCGDDLATTVLRAECEDASLLARMVAVQEDLDWAVYALFDLAPVDTAGRWTTDLELTPEQRPFKSTTPPAHLGKDDHNLWLARAAAIADSKQLRLIENPVNKRRWWGARGVFGHKIATFAERVADAAAEQIGDLAEQILRAQCEHTVPTVITAHALERELADNAHYQALRDFLVTQNARIDPLQDQLARESVPFLAGYRYSASGRDRHNQWRGVWDLQRLADRIEAELPRLSSIFEATAMAAREANERVVEERAKLGNSTFSLEIADATTPPRRRGARKVTSNSETAPAFAATTPKPPALLAAEATEATARAAQNEARLELEWAEACHRKARSLIPTPQKYEPADFRDTTYFRLRGKLDVPRERFISYPGAASNNDTAPVYGWAGWTHLQRALALLQLYYDRKSNEEWLPIRLIPLLAGLEELLPWVAQWHGDEVHPDTGERYVDAFETHIIAGCTELGVTRAQLIDWTPPDNSRTARAAHLDDDNDADAAAKPRKRRAAAPDGAVADVSTAPEGMSENPSSEPSVPKRRGRPPKAAVTAVPGDMSEVTSSEPSAPKRRGRPPKSAPE